MKKVYQKFLTLVMALVMTVSCTAVAFAAEEPAGVTDNTAAVSMATDEGIMPLAMKALSDVIDVTDITTGKTVSGKLEAPDGTSNITVVIYTPVGCTVTLKGLIGSKQRYIPAGGGTFSIAAGWGKFDYSIRFHDASGTKARFQFFGTDGWYDG